MQALRSLLAALLGLVAMVLGTLAVIVPLVATTFVGGLVGIGLHLGAAQLSMWAARERRGGPLLGPERDTVFVMAMFVPVVGPALAWALPHRSETREIEDAHELFERYLEHVEPLTPTHERSLFTGNETRDLARELDVETFAQVLREGAPDQRRNAVRRLVERGGPSHMARVRRCLIDLDEEVRLFAHAELDRVLKTHRRSIHDALDDVAECADADSHTAVAEAHLELAESGILDAAASASHHRLARQSATTALSMGGPRVDAAKVAAVAHSRLGEHGTAVEIIESLSTEEQRLADVREIRASVAFARRRYGVARALGERLVRHNDDLPNWLDALRRQKGAA